MFCQFCEMYHCATLVILCHDNKKHSVCKHCVAELFDRCRLCRAPVDSRPHNYDLTMMNQSLDYQPGRFITATSLLSSPAFRPSSLAPVASPSPSLFSPLSSRQALLNPDANKNISHETSLTIRPVLKLKKNHFEKLVSSVSDDEATATDDSSDESEFAKAKKKFKCANHEHIDTSRTVSEYVSVYDPLSINKNLWRKMENPPKNLFSTLVWFDRYSHTAPHRRPPHTKPELNRYNTFRKKNMKRLIEQLTKPCTFKVFFQNSDVQLRREKDIPSSSDTNQSDKSQSDPMEFSPTATINEFIRTSRGIITHCVVEFMEDVFWASNDDKMMELLKGQKMKLSVSSVPMAQWIDTQFPLIVTITSCPYYSRALYELIVYF